AADPRSLLADLLGDLLGVLDPALLNVDLAGDDGLLIDRDLFLVDRHVDFVLADVALRRALRLDRAVLDIHLFPSHRYLASLLLGYDLALHVDRTGFNLALARTEL